MGDSNRENPPGQQHYPPYQGNPPPWQQPQANFYPPNPSGNPNSMMPSGIPPYGNYSPQSQMAPPVPPKKKLKTWQWVLIGASGLLVFCCVLGAIGSAVGASSTQTSQANNSVVGATSTVRASSTPQPTATTPPSPTPIPLGQGDHMALGSDYQQDQAKGFMIVHPKGTFSASDQLAYVINLDHAIGVTQAQLILVREDTGGVEYSVYSVAITISDPNFTSFANRIPRIGDIMNAFAQNAGKYRLELSDGHAVLAKADFTYTG